MKLLNFCLKYTESKYIRKRKPYLVFGIRNRDDESDIFDGKYLTSFCNDLIHLNRLTRKKKYIIWLYKYITLYVMPDKITIPNIVTHLMYYQKNKYNSFFDIIRTVENQLDCRYYVVSTELCNLFSETKIFKLFRYL